MNMKQARMNMNLINLFDYFHAEKYVSAQP